MKSRINSTISNKLAYPDTVRPTAATIRHGDSWESQQVIFAHSFEFVAKPSEAQRLQTAIPLALTRILKDVTGYGGCLVMVGALEARLVNVVTLWQGPDSHKRCAENVRWIQTVLAPYMDHRLRLQTYLASVPEILAHRPAKNAAAERFVDEPVCPHEDEVCLA